MIFELAPIDTRTPNTPRAVILFFTEVEINQNNIIMKYFTYNKYEKERKRFGNEVNKLEAMKFIRRNTKV